jgi:RNA polymerase sigma-70 factor (ECF subfamily)
VGEQPLSHPEVPTLARVPGADRLPGSAAEEGSEAEARTAAVDPRVHAAATGDRAAARELLTRLLPRARNLVRYLVRGDSEADDLAQDALLAVLRGLPTFRGEAAFESWADRVVARSTFAGLKRRRREATERTEAEAELRRTTDAPAHADDYADRRRAVALLDALPEEQRHALVMRHVLEMSVPEIAVELGAPVETVRSRLRLARRRLRELGLSAGYGADGEDDDAAE